MKLKTIEIAGFKIQLRCKPEEIIGLDEGYTHFILNSNCENPDIIVDISSGIPTNIKEEKNIIFQAKDNNQEYFSIFDDVNGYKIITYSPTNINQIQQVAFLSKDYSNWTIYTEPLTDGILCPLLYPMGPLIFYYLTVKFDAIMIHASGIFDNEMGRIFTGFSGVGKSTMANLWQKSGAQIINDDRLIIRKENNCYNIYNTPMFYIDNSKKIPLNSINLIYHNSKNIIKKVEGAYAISSILAFCIQHSYSKEILNHHLEFLSQLCLKIPVYSVGFKPDNEIVKFIKEHAK